MAKIKIIVGSTRPSRFGIKIGQWVESIAKERTDAEFELVDLKDLELPLLDEPLSAMYGKYSKPHTKKWSSIIDDADGFIFVTGEYNHSVPAALKNAIDFLYHEWSHKPAAFVSYGADAGGTRAIEHLRGTLGQLKMFDLQDFISVVNYWTQQDEAGEFIATEDQETALNTLLDNIVFWSERLQPARDELKDAQLQAA